jgi:NADPH-dependent 2,4-dienoyl-CoA reductase/sulfur reductase-like enzyme/rhodanese-related sulfurtransferase
MSIDRNKKIVTVENLKSGQVFEDSYDYLVLATGAKPKRLPIPGIERALELRNVTDADIIKRAIVKNQAKTAVILGAGFIGLELAENLKNIGLEVTILQRGNQILSQVDPEMTQPLLQKLREEGVEVLFNSVVTEITDRHVILENASEYSADLVFTAAGVEPDISLAREAGLSIGKTGGLWVDDRQFTSDPSILAAGDAVEKQGELVSENTLVSLANLANRHGRLIADVISGKDVHAHPALGTAIVGAFGITLGITGMSEKLAVQQGIAHSVIHVHPNNHANYYPGSTRLSLKAIFDPTTGVLLGAQAVGENGVDKRIDVLATAIRNKMTVDELMDLELSYAPQFGSAKDAINILGYVGNNVWHDMTPSIQWHEIGSAIANGAVLVDVRSASEHSNGAIPDSINIPVDELREKIGELVGKRIVVYCAVGQRGHIATQILKSNDIIAQNLDGGYATWFQAKGGSLGSQTVEPSNR